ncbi:hypothetical protein I3842_14G094600 [Carya illinoinensis]|uniref:Uncharacterized protein n=1 Tax=Carya illinoinensis TaxID=32201 RepID=A0A922DAY4_CARIL|nr:hypothetical protein I3842_14G094600 [Carya illinoinensis]
MQKNRCRKTDAEKTDAEKNRCRTNKCRHAENSTMQQTNKCRHAENSTMQQTNKCRRAEKCKHTDQTHMDSTPMQKKCCWKASFSCFCTWKKNTHMQEHITRTLVSEKRLEINKLKVIQSCCLSTEIDIKEIGCLSTEFDMEVIKGCCLST